MRNEMPLGLRQLYQWSVAIFPFKSHILFLCPAAHPLKKLDRNILFNDIY
jgi:hypothetical protein